MHSAHAVGGNAYAECSAARPAEWRCDSFFLACHLFPSREDPSLVYKRARKKNESSSRLILRSERK